MSNYRVFRENLATALVAIELSLDGKFDLTEGDTDIVIQLCGGALVWQKERLLNLALRAVPADIEHVAWLDCDLILKMNDWAIDAKKHLRDQNLTQLFSGAVFIDPPNYTQRSGRNGSFYVPGLLSRSGAKDLISVWSTIDKKVVSDGIGSGDSLMAAAMLGQHESISRRHSFGEDRRRHYFRRALPNRGYVDRQKGLTSFDFDPDIDRRIGSKRRMGLGKTEPDLELFTRKHVMSRAEDG